jgi:hypothetical protein
MENILFNTVDIYLELVDGAESLAIDDYENFGANIGKIVSDIFIKNPIDFAWQKNNSNVMTASLMSTQPRLKNAYEF